MPPSAGVGATPVPRAAVFAHFDPDGEVAPHVRYALRQLASCCARIVVVSSCRLTDSARRELAAFGPLIERPNSGHDFESYRQGLALIDQDTVEELVVMNDSTVMPLIPMTRVFASMATDQCDFWGITLGWGFTAHVQSYFIVFRRPALTSTAFGDFWRTARPLDSRDDVVVEYEVGLSRTLQSAGLRMGAYFTPSVRDRWIGAVRSAPEDLGQAIRLRGARGGIGWLRRISDSARRPEWNVIAALADRCLDAETLPATKLSVLRSDPYGLGSAGLLAALEETYPVQFAGVRGHLERTRDHYGPHSDSISRTPLNAHLFGYRRG